MLWCWLLPVLVGCATHADTLRQVRQQFYTGDLATAAATLEKRVERGGKDAEVLQLEQAMLLLAQGRPQDAEQRMRQVRDRFDELEQKSVVEATVATFTDDTHRAYAGEDYEKLLLRAMLSLANLMHDGGDAGAYALQIGQKQQQIVETAGIADEQNPKLAYKQLALGPYLYGVLREETHVNYDDAARSYAKVVSWEPGFSLAAHDLQRVEQGTHSAPGHGVVYVFALVGRGPYKEESLEIPSSAALLIADRILSATNKQTLPPTVAPIKVPVVVLSHNEIDAVGVSVGGRPFGSTATITDVGRLAVEQYDAVFPQVLARAVVRRAVKKGAIYASKDALGVDKGSITSLAIDLGGVAWEATEAADTRCWGLLPDKIQVLRVELPAGEHQLGLVGLHHGEPLGTPVPRKITVADGRNTYVLANFPSRRLAGEILVR